MRVMPQRRGACLAALLLVFSLFLVFTAPGLARQTPSRHVVLFSFDGTRADALQSVWPAALGQQGAVSWSARTIMPSTTLPAHTSMVTGVGPEIHRVRFNDWDPDMPPLALPTIFTRVRAAGGKVVILVAKPKLRFLAPADMPVEWLLFPRYRQAAVIATAAQRFGETRPSLLFVHIADPDDAGHRSGWMSAPYLDVVREIPALVDQFLGQLRRARAAEDTLVIVTSDHGGHGILHGTSRPEDMTIPWIVLGGLARRDVVLQQPIAIFDTAATVLYALGLPIPQQWQGRPVIEALHNVPAGR